MGAPSNDRMPPKLALTSVFILLPLFVADTARAELPNGTAFRERMVAKSAEPARPVAEQPAPGAAAVKRALPRLSSRYGVRPDPVDGGQRFHAGIDIPGAAGSPVLASAGGTVTFAGYAGGYGRMIEIDHGGGMRTRYAHLDQLLVRPGSQVGQGAIVGRIGSTGRSTGPHLHFEVRRQGRPVDPVALLSATAPSRPVPRQWEQHDQPHLSDYAKARASAVQREIAN